MIKNVIEYLQDSANKFPEKIAIIDGNNKITFEELNRSAKALGAVISKECNGMINQPVAVCMEKGAKAIISFLAIAYSGNFYTPLDINTPNERLIKIVKTLKPIITIYDKCEPNLEAELGILLDFNRYDLRDEEETILLGYQKVLDLDPIYTLFTSGSTGLPKGVVISHRSVIDYVEWLKDTFDFNEKTVFGNQAPFCFDNSVLDIYSTLKNGSTMCIIPDRYFAFHNKLFDYINENGVNTIFWVPSALISVANSGIMNRYKMEHLHTVLFAGEVMPNKQLNMWRKYYPHALYANLYGPTEITDICTYYIVNKEFKDNEPLPIGKACNNMEILIINDQNGVCGVDEIGELCVRGTGLSMGYYGDFDKTQIVFVQNPLNNRYRDLIYRTGDLAKVNSENEIIYIGRKDFQIKHQGHRIELGEIETAASSIEGISMVGAIYDLEETSIVLFCETVMDITEKNIYSELKLKIPRYMLPAHIVLVNKIPLNINGKVDRTVLLNNWKEGFYE